MQKKTIVKIIRAEEPYEIILRKTLQDKRLSLCTLGALVRLISQPRDWRWELWHIEKQILGVSRDARKKIFGELEKNGYLVRNKFRDSRGHWQHSYELFSVSQKPKSSNDETSDGNPGDGLSVAGESGDIIDSTDSENTDLDKPQLTPSAGAEVEPAAQSCGGCNLIFDKAIDKTLHQELTAMLKNVQPSLAQSMLDTLAQKIIDGENNKKYQVNNALNLMAHFINKKFDPTGGLAISKRREREAAEVEKRKKDDEEKTKPRHNPAIGKKSLVLTLKTTERKI